MRRPSRQRRRAAPSRKGGLNIRTSPCGQPRTDLQPSDYRTLILPHTRALCCQCIRQHGLEPGALLSFALYTISQVTVTGLIPIGTKVWFQVVQTWLAAVL